MTILIIGGGKMGMSHLALITQYVGKSNIALCDSKLSNRILFHFMGYQTFKSISGASKLNRIDGVIIATPTSSHASLAKWAIENNVPVFIEKPLTLDKYASEELVQLAKLSNAHAQVGFVMRYVESFNRLRNFVNCGSLGTVKKYSASMLGNVVLKKLASDSWQGDFSRGGGALNEYGPHIIDLCRFIFGPVEVVDSVEMTSVFSEYADDFVDISWTHSDRVPGTVKIDWCDASKRKSVIEFFVQFEYADVRADNSSIEIEWHKNAPLSMSERLLINATVMPKNVTFYLRGEEFSLEIEDFLRYCFGRNFSSDVYPTEDITPRLEDGYEVDLFIDMIARKAGLK